MKFFNFFRQNKPVINQESTQNQVASTTEVIDKQLFVEERSPVVESPEYQEATPIDSFLSVNYQWQGFTEGYSNPEKEFLDEQLRLIQGKFLLAVDQAMDQRRVELGRIRMHQIDTAGISDRMEAKLKEKIRQIEVVIHELDTQRILSIESQGIISSAISAYKIGFRKGLEKYQEEKLFAASTGLFNK